MGFCITLIQSIAYVYVTAILIPAKSVYRHIGVQEMTVVPGRRDWYFFRGREK